jgi:hypothetical protein
MSQDQAVYEVDEVMSRYTELSLLNIIPDMAEHAKEWQRLAMKADIADRPSTAEACRSRAKYYYELTGGEYIRLVEGCFAELIPVVYLLSTPAEAE